MTATFAKTFTRENTNINWPPQVREVDDYVDATYPGNLTWRVTYVSDDELTLSYTSTWASIAELEAALEDEVILNNISQITEYCNNNNIAETYSIN